MLIYTWHSEEYVVMLFYITFELFLSYERIRKNHIFRQNLGTILVEILQKVPTILSNFHGSLLKMEITTLPRMSFIE